MKSLFDQNGHLTDTGLHALFAGVLDETQSLDIAEHVCICESCAAKLALCAEQSTVQPPRGITELTLDTIERDQHKKKKDFRHFCIRVAACAALVVGMLVTGIFYIPENITLAPPPERDPLPPPEIASVSAPTENTSILNDIGDFFKNLPNILFNLEDNNND